MKSMDRIGKTFTAAAASALVGLVGASHAQAQVSGEVVIDGSSTVAPISQAVAEEFNNEYPQVRVGVGVHGTGGGFEKFTRGETDISDASRPIKQKEAQAAKQNGVEFIELPVAYDGLSIVVNKNNDWVDQLSVEDLRKIFLADQAAKTWKDVNPEWPATPIRIYAPGTASGTFDYFNEVVAGDEGSIRSDMSVSEDDNVLVRGVVNDKGAIGFFGSAYYFENQDELRAVPIVNDQGQAVKPTVETIGEGTYNPFSRPLFIYVSKKSLQRPAVEEFVDFYLEEAPYLAEEVGYVALPEELSDQIEERYENRVTGTVYLDEQGQPVKGSLTQLYQTKQQ